ncbi:MAG: serine/threonine protein kinase [Deltaproteobacteria bacterium]|nr:serine/threonine protein kinase [Deltaproteobacteria bacterium]
MPDVATTADPLLGHEIQGTYKIVDVLGQGGMAVVYRGRHVLTDQVVAVKALTPELAAQAEVRKRFLAEARTLGRLEHPNIVGLHNFIEEDGHLYLIMQYAEGETFDEIIEREGRVSVADAISIACETLKALQYAHDQNVVHRDIKPSNIIIRGDSSVKVMDFGIAKIAGSTKLTTTGQTMGTVRFMAPEQVRGKDIDHRADLYALGVAIYQAVTGKTPFDGDTHFDIMRKHLTEVPSPPGDLADIPEALNTVLLHALEKRPDARFQSADEFRRALAAIPIDASDRRLTRSVPLPTIDDDLAGDGGAEAQDKASSSPAVSATAAMPTAASKERSSRLGLQVAVAGLLLVLAGGAVLWALFTDGDAKRVTPPKKVTSHVGSAKAPGTKTIVWPPLHRVAKKLHFRTDQRFPKLHLRLLSVAKRDAPTLAAYYAKARGAYTTFLRGEGIPFAVEVGPLNLFFVPQAVLNSKTHWSGIRPGVDYPTRYLAPARTLYVQDGKGALDNDLPYGLALHFCARLAQLSNQRCLDLAGGFETYMKNHKSK